VLNLPELRAIDALADMRLLQRGNRLSVMPVDKTHWDLIAKLLKK
jgi:predicted RNA-binding protein with PUA-like domain